VNFQVETPSGGGNVLFWIFSFSICLSYGSPHLAKRVSSAQILPVV